jgi:hypothetical protein
MEKMMRKKIDLASRGYVIAATLPAIVTWLPLSMRQPTFHRNTSDIVEFSRGVCS